MSFNFNGHKNGKPGPHCDCLICTQTEDERNEMLSEEYDITITAGDVCVILSCIGFMLDVEADNMSDQPIKTLSALHAKLGNQTVNVGSGNDDLAPGAIREGATVSIDKVNVHILDMLANVSGVLVPALIKKGLIDGEALAQTMGEVAGRLQAENNDEVNAFSVSTIVGNTVT